MRRIVIWLASTVTIVVLLFGYHTSTNSAASTSGTSSSTAPAVPSGTSSAAPPDPTSSSSSSPSPSASKSSTPKPSAPKSSAPTTKTYTGDVAQTRWGPVEVEITVKSGTITKVSVPQYPDGNGRDAEINSQALPQLIQETLDAQSAKIDMVSGATVTSDGYLSSLQSALDKAGI